MQRQKYEYFYTEMKQFPHHYNPCLSHHHHQQPWNVGRAGS